MERAKLVDYVSSLSRWSATRSPSESYTKLDIRSRNGLMELQAQSNCGVAIVSTDIESDLASQVDFRSFHGFLSRTSAKEITLTPKGNRLKVKADNRSDVDFPVFEFAIPSINECTIITTISAKDWLDSEVRMSLLGVETEVEFAAGVRVFSEGDTVSLSMSCKNGMCGCDIPGSGGGIDVTVPVESVRALSNSIKQLGCDTVSLGYHNNNLYVEAGPLRAAIPTIVGRPPYKRADFERLKSLKGSIIWDAPKAELMEALRQAEIFSEAGSSGIDIFPDPAGLHIERKSVNDEGIVMTSTPGEFHCVIPGRYEGERLIIRREALAAMLKHCDDNYKLYASPRAVCVESGNFYAGYSCMTRGQR